MREPEQTILPDYRGGSIVNLMTSIAQAFGAEEGQYPRLRALSPQSLESRNVVLLVIDGLGHDFLLAHCRDGVLASHLKGRITSVFPSTTASAITTFLTGTAPQQHAITGWFTYFRELGAVLTVLPYRPRHGGSAPAIPVGRLLDHVPVFDRLEARSHVVAPDRIVHSDFNAAHNGDARLHGFGSLGEMFKRIGAAVRERGDRNYVYAYWPELDRLAHEHGIGSSTAVEHLAELDLAFGRFLDGIRGTDTTVIVTADHGFIDLQREQRIELEAHPRLERSLLLPLCGESRVAYCYVRADQRSEFSEYVNMHLAQHAGLAESGHLIESGYFGLGAPHPRLHERIGDYTLIMKGNAVIKDWLPGEQRYVQVGAHGGVSAAEMYVPLIVTEA